MNLRMMLRVAQLYYEDKLKQAEISQRLHVSQATVSRLLKRAEKEGVVRVTIAAPRGTYPQYEAALRERYGLNEAIVAECYEDREEAILSAIGAAAAHYLEATLSEGDVIGISSWSVSLLRMVDAIHPIKRIRAERVVQTLGGIGDPSVQSHATQLTMRLAALTGAEPQLLPAQGVVSSSAARLVMVGDVLRPRRDGSVPPTDGRARGHRRAPAVRYARQFRQRLHRRGTARPRRGAARSAISACGSSMAKGAPVHGPLDERVISITLEELKSTPRVIGVAGGNRKIEAIRACLVGKLVNVLITDKFTAEELL